MFSVRTILSVAQYLALQTLNLAGILLMNTGRMDTPFSTPPKGRYCLK
jgi:hypothetical protein